ncbi:MAG: 4-hydroxythreonine-4-phosphate dehydrogenase PdxA [Tannerella sp.]|jgi:4-hydroxythreonine-4-phosphate dehydrogenase|nr:4-hydroxythreonine-4-phosphate dehydrogenase PdxA [Tannerella sp.]
MEDKLIKVGLTHGDINGIAYELLLKTFSDPRMTEFCAPIIYGSTKVAAYHRKALDFPQFSMTSINRPEESENGHVHIINCITDDAKVELSKATDYAASAAKQSLQAAVADLKRGALDLLVTAPVSRQLKKEDKYPEEAGYIKEQWGDGTPFPIFLHDTLRITPLTGDLRLAEAPAQLTLEGVVDKLQAFDRSLREDFNVERPRIALLSLNPHAEGNEEDEILRPAMEKVEKQGLLVFGPYAADDFFCSEDYTLFDGIAATYYEQALLSFKELTGREGLCYTAGLPVVHTTTIHGAAYDIAGKGEASEASFRQAIYAALDIFRNRAAYKEATRNPLRKQYFEKGAVEEKLDLTKEAYDEP